MNQEVILNASGISKQYRLGSVGTGTVSHDLNRWWARIRGKEDPYLKIGEVNDRSTKGESDYVWALQDINFDVYKGEVLGIIGKNGAGKSTLLKILSRVTAPTTGSIKTRGRIASLLEVGTGFNGEMTGRENIFLNGAILGMTKKEIQSKIAEIIEFSGCQRYIDTPVKRYSSGMTVRLAFAVAAFLEPEILVIDEVLAVGDAEFQKKAIGKMQDISKGEGRTVVFVSHNMAAVKSLCTRGIVMEHGGIVFEGGIEECVNNYQISNLDQTEYYVANSVKEIYIKGAKLKASSNNFYSDESIAFVIEVAKNIKFSRHKFLLVRVMDHLDQVLFSSETELDSNKDLYNFIIPSHTLVKGNYKMNFIIYHPAVAQYDNVIEFCSFVILENIKAFSHLETFDIGKIYIEGKWE
ncbi:ABC transporter ATP-binding protein [Flavobacterium qiangtangense]|uniref:ABC transporter ATP-binding protein n=1 Tax=Flavobacterium qiangtangense TaxID=1442595 RepID=A0ABW1PR63_9FLAO